MQAICDYVHNHIAFDYQNARATRTAWEAFNERTGVCRDYAHLAVTFCRCMNIPARYCTGYLGDMGTPPPWAVGDFAAWFEVFIGGAGTLSIPATTCRGSDACSSREAAMPPTWPSPPPSARNMLESFKVWTDEITESMTAGSL